MPVVDREHVTSFEAAADFSDPIARFQPRLGLLAFAQSDALHRKILGYGASRERRQNVHKVPVAEADENLFQRASIHHDPMHRQRIDQFIGKETA